MARVSTRKKRQGGRDAGQRDLPENQAFLVRVGQVLHAYGTPSHRLERLLMGVADFLGVTMQVLTTPTSLMLSMGSGDAERTMMLRVSPGDVDLGKLVELDVLLEELEDGHINVAQARERLEAVARSNGRYGAVPSALAFSVASGSAAVFLGGGLAEFAAALVLGMLIFLGGSVARKIPREIEMTEAVLAFGAATAALVWARFVGPIHFSKVTMAALIILIPGLSLTVAMLELATQHLSSGVARLAGAGAKMLTIFLGVALAWKLGDSTSIPMHEPVPLDPVWKWTIMATAPISFAVLFQVRLREWWVVYLAGVAGFVGAILGGLWLGEDLGPFLGAFAVGIVGNLYARILDRPASVAQMPGMLLLVPGTVGYSSLISFMEAGALAGTQLAFRTAMVGSALVGGLLAANALIPPRRTL
ncbi:MAG: threonine/serine exporter family protein [Planctomycetes bacterium]|nr:threonine/serine exporter family protein [Planctomycetota bacterium]